VVLKDDCLSIPEMRSDLLAFFAVKHHASELRIHGVVFVEAQAVLCNHIKLAAEHGERFAVHAVGVTLESSVMLVLTTDMSGTNMLRGHPI
jgi:hypothetical protein